MSEMLPFLKTLLSLPGLSGSESAVAERLRAEWTPLVSETSLSRLGSLHALKAGTGDPPRPSVMIAAHMDAVGFMVSHISGEFLHLAPIGHLDPQILPGAAVTVHPSNGGAIHGILVVPPLKERNQDKGDGEGGRNQLFVDTGLAAGELAKWVRVGDSVSFGTVPLDLPGDCVCGRALDNRASIAALTLCLQELQARPHPWDVWAVASVQEEITFAGAYTSAYHIHPSIAVAVDVTYGSGPGDTDYSMFPIGKGITLGVGPTIHPALRRRFKEVAARCEIAAVDEPMPHTSLTDADAIQVTGAGIPTMVIGIPLRYMHTAVEIVALEDIRRAGRLLAEFVATLEADFLDRVVWD